jgi:hypothetical protein
MKYGGGGGWMSLKAVAIRLAAVAVLSGVGYGAYQVATTAKDKERAVGKKESTSSAPITGPQAAGQNVLVKGLQFDVGPRNLSGDEEVIVAGYSGNVSVSLYSDKQMSQIALEDLVVNNLNALGDCTVSEKDASVDAYTQGETHLGLVIFKIICRTGISYTRESVLAKKGSYEGSQLLSHGGLTPEGVSRSLSFNVVIKFDDGTITKKSFSGKIDGAMLSNGAFGAGKLAGLGEKF